MHHSMMDRLAGAGVGRARSPPERDAHSSPAVPEIIRDLFVVAQAEHLHAVLELVRFVCASPALKMRVERSAVRPERRLRERARDEHLGTIREHPREDPAVDQARTLAVIDGGQCGGRAHWVELIAHAPEVAGAVEGVAATSAVGWPVAVPPDRPWRDPPASSRRAGGSGAARRRRLEAAEVGWHREGGVAVEPGSVATTRMKLQRREASSCL